MYSTNLAKRFFAELQSKFRTNQIDYPIQLSIYDQDYTVMEKLVYKSFSVSCLNFNFSSVYQEILDQFLFNLETEQKYGSVELCPRLVFEIKHYESTHNLVVSVYASTKQ